MNKSKLKADLSQKLNQLEEKVKKICDAGIDPDNEETWDYDHYSVLQSKLETTLELFKNKIIPGKLDEYGDPVISEKGILSLLDEWHEQNSEDDGE